MNTKDMIGKQMDSKSLLFDLIDFGIQITLTKNYIGKEFPFYMSCILPIYFEYSKNRCVHPSFIIETPLENIELKEGNWDENNKATDNYCFSLDLTDGYGKIIMLETPENYQNKGFATAALKIIKDILFEYNKYIETIPFPEAKDLRKIETIYGEAIACGNKALKQERLIEFYRKNGFKIKDKNKLTLVL